LSLVLEDIYISWNMTERYQPNSAEELWYDC